MTKQLSPKHFDALDCKNLKSKKCTFVLFYVDWCGYCKRMQGDWKKLGDTVAFMDIARYNCDTYPSHFQHLKSEGIIGSFPTIILYKNGKPFHSYKGDRDVKSLLNFAIKSCNLKQVKVKNGKLRKLK